VANRHRISPLEQATPTEVTETIREAYDDELARTKGGKWYAGIDAVKLEGSYAKAYDFVQSQTDLIDQHMVFLKDIEARLSGAELRKAKEDVRYNLAAALDDRRKGKAVTSISDSGDNARAAGINYDRDCPDGNSANSTTSQANSLGFKSKEFITNCPLCREQKVKATMAGGMISCGSCGDSVDVCTGEIVRGRKSKKKLGKNAVAEAMKPHAQKLSKPELIRAQYGPAITEHKKVTVGGMEHFFVHKQTGQRIDI
jgi:hypothetical protein